MEENNISPEQYLIYRIVEQWGNVINMPRMEGWLKEYARKLYTEDLTPYLKEHGIKYFMQPNS